MAPLPHVLLALDADDVIRSASGETERLLGYLPKELEGLAAAAVLEETRTARSWDVRRVACRTKLGQTWDTHARSAPVFAEDGSPAGTMELLSDALRTRGATADGERAQLAIEDAPYAVLLVDHTGRIARLNEAALRLFGYAPGLLEGQSVQCLVPEPSRAAHAEHMAGFLRRPGWRSMGAGRELLARRQDGSTFPAHISLSTSEHAGAGHVVVTVLDLTARKLHEQALRENEARFRQIAESLPQLIWTSTPDGRAEFLNMQWREYTGADVEQLLEEGWFARIHEQDRASLWASWQAALGSGAPLHEEVRILRNDGSHRWFDVRALALRARDGTVVRWFGANTDIDEMRAIREHLRAMQTQLTTALEAGQMGVWILRVDTGELWTDDRLLQVFGRTRAEIQAQPEGLFAFVHEEDRARVRAESERLRAGGLFAGFEFRVSRGDGQQVWLACRGRSEFDETRRVVAVVGVTWDVTRQRAELDSQLRSQKLEALGTLSGGIAHDFNNLLQAISGHASLALDGLPSVHPLHENLAQIAQASERGAELVRRILTFSRPEEQKREQVQLRDVVREATQLLRATLPSSIALRTEYAPEELFVHASPTQLHQVVVNLATNAAHAIGSQPGAITLRVDPVQIGDDEFGGSKLGLTPGKYVMLEVCDDGCGMSSEVRARIFDPFFTTKGATRGTGLGLSVVHSIVTSLAGAVDVVSAPEQGTTFQIYLPRSERPRAVRSQVVANYPRGNGERVLYVDDDPILVALGKSMLEAIGYQVTCCAGPHEAWQAFSAQPDEFDIVLSDVTMPMLSGFELARRVLSLRADIPVLVMSGYVGPEQRELSREVGAREILVKPVPMAEFGRAIARHVRAP
jgi:PAS domain S-box-containing protein